MLFSRRSFLAAAVAAPFSARAAKIQGLKIGVTDWNLRKTGQLDAVALAKSIGFDGVEVSLGRKPVDNRLPFDSPELQRQYLEEARKHGVHLAGTCLDILHVNYLKNDSLGQRWLASGIQITRQMDARVMLLPFFGKGALSSSQEMDYVSDVLREHGPEAAKADILLGVEDTLSAEDNARILDRARSPAVKVYYDIGNSTLAGYNPVTEIPWLGRERICQFHLKDNPHFLDEGKINLPAVMREIARLQFNGFANLETVAPSGSIEADMLRNLKYVRGFTR